MKIAILIIIIIIVIFFLSSETRVIVKQFGRSPVSKISLLSTYFKLIS